MKLRMLALATMLLLSSGIYAQAVDPKVQQSNIQQTICVSGYTATVRPPVSYTNKIKLAQLAAIGKKPSDASMYELDHVVPLEVGGSPKDPTNLKLQLWDGTTGAHAKDVVENRMHKYVCNGKITLAAAQYCMSNDWTKCPK